VPSMSMSVDGFIAGPHDTPAATHIRYLVVA
jgi:hypothetical protein